MKIEKLVFSNDWRSVAYCSGMMEKEKIEFATLYASAAKKDEPSHIFVDYWKSNTMTICDWYRLLHKGECLHCLKDRDSLSVLRE